MRLKEYSLIFSTKLLKQQAELSTESDEKGEHL
jgi:hypothetical protein